MIYTIFIVLHVIICVLIVMVILMQASKGKGLAGAFGGMGSMASGILGARGTATFLSKATTYLAVAFFVNCILLSLLSGTVGTVRSVVQEQGQFQSPAQNLPLVPGAMEQAAGGGDALPTNTQPQSQPPAQPAPGTETQTSK